MKRVWLLEVLFLIFPVSFVSETFSDEAAAATENPMHAYRSPSSNHGETYVPHSTVPGKTPENQETRTLRGTLTDPGLGCLQLENEKGEKVNFSLTLAQREEFKSGDRVKLTYSPTPVSRSFCTEVAVQHIEKIN